MKCGVLAREVDARLRRQQSAVLNLICGMRFELELPGNPAELYFSNGFSQLTPVSRAKSVSSECTVAPYSSARAAIPGSGWQFTERGSIGFGRGVYPSCFVHSAVKIFGLSAVHRSKLCDERATYENRARKAARFTSASEATSQSTCVKSWWAVDSLGAATVQTLARFAASEPVYESSKATASWPRRPKRLRTNL